MDRCNWHELGKGTPGLPVSAFLPYERRPDKPIPKIVVWQARLVASDDDQGGRDIAPEGYPMSQLPGISPEGHPEPLRHGEKQEE